MSIPTDQLVANVRSRANIERTKHVLDSEIVQWLNDEGRIVYNKLVDSREEYVSRLTQFTLNTPFFVENDVETYVNGQTVLVNISAGATGLAVDFALLPAPTYYKLYSFTVAPQSSNTTGDTGFQLRKGGFGIADVITIPSGSNASVTHYFSDLTFVNTDVIDMLVSAGAGADWNATVTIVVTPFVSTSIANAAPLPVDFLKPIDVSFPLDSNGRRQEIPPLESVHNKTYVTEYRYLTSDELIYIYPQFDPRVGPYDLSYVPFWKDLTLDPAPNSIIKPMERFSDTMCIGAASTAKIKRKMLEDAQALRTQANATMASVLATIPGRKGSPKQIPMPLKDRQRYAGAWRIRRF
jgi:hypothetical protein